MTSVLAIRRAAVALYLALACAAVAYSVVGARASGLELQLVRPPFAQAVDCALGPEPSGGTVPCT